MSYREQDYDSDSSNSSKHGLSVASLSSSKAPGDFDLESEPSLGKESTSSSSDDSSIEIDSQPSTDLRKMKVSGLQECLKAKDLPYIAKRKEDLINRLLG